MNKLTINLDKTKVKMFAEFLDIVIGGKNLQYVIQFNYLGVRLDSRLTFEMHAVECIRLVLHKIYLLTKIRSFIDKKQALAIYKGKIMPYFDYGDILIGTHVKTRDMLQKLQNRALRLVLGRDSRHNVWELHHEAIVPYLDKIRDCHLANFVFKRKASLQYLCVPMRPLRQYEAPVFVEYRAENSEEVYYIMVLNTGTSYLLMYEI